MLVLQTKWLTIFLPQACRPAVLPTLGRNWAIGILPSGETLYQPDISRHKVLNFRVELWLVRAFQAMTSLATSLCNPHQHFSARFRVCFQFQITPAKFTTFISRSKANGVIRTTRVCIGELLACGNQILRSQIILLALRLSAHDMRSACFLGLVLQGCSLGGQYFSWTTACFLFEGIEKKL